ncbi:exodeoxyribonuclease V subunit alpha [Shewanella colwelliana]|uniref:RecBCD enzyme subunit RecD n=1 Tax=Shewanella colwelliana TaxID=23 RepID=A0A1E5IZ61_SHECO|nr:exodeoxyribonuclease V subunit alpha [Shewanella colwelliana]OEG75845.1 exodeoxyribonuclease V subunit alpha [Shewanella colwelliana]
MIALDKPLERLLKEWEQQRLLTALDRHFALEMSAMHADSTPLFTFICALLSRQLSLQHTCLPLNLIDSSNPLAEVTAQCQLLGSTVELVDALSQSSAVGTPSDTGKPLILDGNNLYLQRYYQFEYQVSEQLKRLCVPIDVDDIPHTQTLLSALFSPTAQALDWQKIATATAFSHKLAVITGGPGTGKTTTVTKLLLLLCQQQTLTIKLVAPTGKAAARLSESIKASKVRLATELGQKSDPLSLTALAAVPEEATTLHRLLGVIPNSHRFRHHKDNPLRLDLLIVDEASMVDLPMMHKLLDALPEHARLILLGDQDQLASVEAGAVLADICAGLKQVSADGVSQWRMRYSPDKAKLLSQLTASDLTPFVSPDAQIGDALAMLMHSHRFQGDAGIGLLAGAVNRSDLEAILHVWQQGYQELLWIEHQDTPQGNLGLQALLTQSVEHYGVYLKAIASGCHTPSEVIDRFNQYRILCAMRVGEFGVEGINASVSQALAQAQLISLSHEFYAGRPVIIQSNDYNLGLFNGDIGVILPDETNHSRLMAHFVQADGSLLKVLPARLPSHETCFAMTVHKSQGSEFSQVALVLPPRPSAAQRQLLSKELVYTAITRAKNHFSCLGSQKIFEAACAQATQRASGLANRLWQS